MSASKFQQKLKPWVLPISMVAGAFFHDTIRSVEWVVPYLIFTMLFITFCKVRPSEFRVSGMVWRMLAVQILGAVAMFVAVKPLNPSLAQAVFICVLCPTATAAPVVTGMLGGSVAKVATYSIVSNLAVAILAPFLFVWVGDGNVDMDFAHEFLAIASRVAPLIILPLLLAWGLGWLFPPVVGAVAKAQQASFYLWAVSLFIVVGRAVSFVLAEPPSYIPVMVAMAVGAAVVCCVQFYVGRRIGIAAGHPVAGAQGLGQKNTILAIWMCLTYLNPVSSIGPAAYIVWQNSINSWQMYYKMRRDAAAQANGANK